MSDEKTDREGKLPDKTDPVGQNTHMGLAGLEMSQVEILEKTTPGKKVAATEPPTKPDAEPTPDVHTRIRTSSAAPARPPAIQKVIDHAGSTWTRARRRAAEAWKTWVEPWFDETKDPAPSTLALVEHFGPTILVCFLFFGWVMYDRSAHPRADPREIASNRILLEAMEELAKGNGPRAEALALSAAKLTRDDAKLEAIQRILAEIE